MNIKEATEILNRIDIKFFLSGMIEQNNYIVDKADEVNTAIYTVLNELDKKDKVIDMMAECIDGEPTFGYGHLRDINTPEKVKEYFYKKIGG